MTEKDLIQLQKQIENMLQDHNPTHGLARVLRLLLKEITLAKNHIEGLKEWEKNKNKFDRRKIQIGGGKHLLKGFLNIDIVPPADLICDLREGIPLEDSCSEFIFSEHFFEHVDYPISAKKIISEIYRILKPGGQIVLGVPDSKLAARSYVNKDQKYYKQAINTWYANRDCLKHFNTYIDLLNYHYRDQDDNKKYNPHYWAYDFEKLKSLFKNTGFSRVKRWDFDPAIANPKREWGSVYIIATK